MSIIHLPVITQSVFHPLSHLILRAGLCSRYVSPHFKDEAQRGLKTCQKANIQRYESGSRD